MPWPARARRAGLWMGVVAALVTIAVGVVPRFLFRGLVGSSYYGRSAWSDAPRLVVVGEPLVDDWLAAHQPQFGSRPFSAQWDGWFWAEASGAFEFATESDDGSWLYVDDRLIVDNGGEHAPIERRGSVTLARGPHRLRIHYEQLAGDAYLRVRVSQAGRPARPLGLDVLYPTRTAAYLHTTWRPAYVLAMLWSGVLLVATLAWLVAVVRRHTRRAPADGATKTWLWRLLGGSAVLMVWQIAYGLPGGWEPDEVTPGHVVEGLSQGFSGGWHALYAPIYYYVLGVFSLPFVLAARAGGLELWSEDTVATLQILYRLVTVLCGLITVYLAYRCGTEAFASRRVGLWAGTVTALVPNVIYLSKLAKPDMPYVAAFMAGMLAYLKSVRDPSPSRYAAVALASTVAVCIKDQAYGLLVLPALHLVWLRWRAHVGTIATRLLRTATDRALLTAAGVALATFALAHNVVLNWEGFRQHMTLVFVGGSGDAFRLYDATLEGYATMAKETLWLVPWMLGWPITALAVAGGVTAWREHRTAMLALVLPAVSYYLLFIAVIRYQYDRFYLAPAVLLAIFAGRGLEVLWSRQQAWSRAAAAVIVAHAVAIGASVDLMMSTDSRLAAETWLKDHVSTPAAVGVVGPRAYLPRAGDLTFVDIPPFDDVLEIVAPEFLVVNAEYAQRPGSGVFYQALLADTHRGYRLVARFKTPPGPALLAYRAEFSNGEENKLTNLDKINPDIRVFARRDVALP